MLLFSNARTLQMRAGFVRTLLLTLLLSTPVLLCCLTMMTSRENRSRRVPVAPVGLLSWPDHSNVSSVGRREDDGRWFNYSSPPSLLFYAYSAFYDNRPTVDGKPPVVRLIALSTNADEQKKRNMSLRCVLHYADGENLTVAMNHSDPSAVGMGYPLNGVNVQELIYACPLLGRPGVVPVGVSVVAVGPGVPTDGEGRRAVPVEVPAEPARRRDFAVCVQIAWGTKIDPLRLVEWFELLRLLGVSLVGVYLASDVHGVEALSVLEHYGRVDGLVDLRRSDYIGPVDGLKPPSADQYLLHGSPVINDCIYRHMHSFRRIGVFDFDEVIVPRQHRNYVEMISSLDSKHGSKDRPPAAYVFSNNYFFLDAEPDLDETTNYTMIRYRRKVPVSDPGYSVKSIIDPETCVNMHNHYCWGFVRPGLNNVDVDQSVAVNQHYKRCHFSSDECSRLLSKTTVDNTVAAFRDRLVQAVDRKRTAIGV